MTEYTEIILKLVLAVILGGLVGYERKTADKPEGMRTLMMVTLGSCLFAIIGGSIAGGDISRVAAGLVTGVGFLGAGMIFRDENRVRGLTTAATIWVVASLGLAIGLGQYFISIAGVILVLGILKLKWLRTRKKKIK